MEISDKKVEELASAAKKALDNRYPKDAQFAYSAAVLTDAGNIYSASNYGSDTHSLTLHAEQSVLAHAAAHGEGSIVAIAIASTEELEKGMFTPPCHMCKQLLWESYLNSKIPMLIVFTNQHDEIKKVNLDDMISFPWPAR